MSVWINLFFFCIIVFVSVVIRIDIKCFLDFNCIGIKKVGMGILKESMFNMVVYFIENWYWNFFFIIKYLVFVNIIDCFNISELDFYLLIYVYVLV